MGTVAEFISENKTVFDSFVRCGKMPISVNRQFQIFNHYKVLEGKSKMQRYEQTAIEMGSNLTDVKKAVREMNKMI